MGANPRGVTLAPLPKADVPERNFEDSYEIQTLSKKPYPLKGKNRKTSRQKFSNLTQKVLSIKR